jgi:hypothetical protein
MRALLHLILLLLVAGCTTVVTQVQLDRQLGRPDPTRFDRPAAPPAEAPDYQTRVRPILERRCVACHACYDAPCQLKLTRHDGITRGANPESVYAGTRLLAASPNRLGFDAHSNAAWRDKGFHPVLNERASTPQANRDASVLYRILALKQRYPGPDSGPLPAGRFDFSLDRAQTCSRIEGMGDFEKDHPEWGMPFGLPALSPAEHDTLSRWIEAGAPFGPRAPLPPQVLARVGEWEALLNGNSLRDQLAARYIYEHWFIGQLYLDDKHEHRFELVRSRSAPGQPIDVIATRRPYDDPGVARVYYRLRPTDETLVAKTHMPLALDEARRARLKKWFFDAPISVDRLPGYDPKTASNPFAAFKALPVDARYRFMLDDAGFTVMGFMKGPVCRGQVALNVINDHFWVLFYSPESEVARDTQGLLDATRPNLRMPAEDDSSTGILAWNKYARAERRYLETKSSYLANLPRIRPQVTDLWNGDGRNPNAGLTVFRHFDSASVIRGLAGEQPQTVLLMGYPLFERMHYLLVAGFDVYGNTGHQLATRLYMDFLRMEGEENFLTLLPLKNRQKVLDSWYRGRPDPRIRQFADARAYFPGETGMRYRTADPLGELYATVHRHLRPVRPGALELAPNGLRAEQVAQLRSLNDITGRSASQMPEHSLLVVHNGKGPVRVLSLLRNSAHSNVAGLFDEDARRLPDEDSLIVLDGIVGAYPNVIFHLDADELPRFVRTVRNLASDADILRLHQRFAIRRTDARFWRISDAIHDYWQNADPRQAAILDYSRLDNR